MVETVATRASIGDHFGLRAQSASRDVKRAEAFASHFETSGTASAQKIASAQKLISRLDHTGSALAIEGFAAGRDAEVETSVATVEKAADRLRSAIMSM